jgi:general secretion pathway protein D
MRKTTLTTILLALAAAALSQISDNPTVSGPNPPLEQPAAAPDAPAPANTAAAGSDPAPPKPEAPSPEIPAAEASVGSVTPEAATDGSPVNDARPSREQRLAAIQESTRLREPAAIEGPSSTDRPLPEMRLLAQASTPESTQSPPQPPPPGGAPDARPPEDDRQPSMREGESRGERPSGEGFGSGRRFGGRGPGGPGFGGPGFGGGPPGGPVGPGGAPGEASSDTMVIEGDKVALQFPNNPVADLLGIYERLTTMTLVKDTSIFEGATISLVTPAPVERTEAIRLIEAALLTNGYAIVIDPDGKSARILPARTQGATTVQFSHGVTFYQSERELPTGETLVTYFMPLENLSPQDAGQILANHVGLSVYGRMTPVLTPPGLLITESATIVRQLISIKEAIDGSSSASSLITKFIPIVYADAAIVAQIVQATVNAQAQEQEAKGLVTLRGSPVSQPQPPSGSSGSTPSSGSSSSSSSSSRSSSSSSSSRDGVQQIGGGSAPPPMPSAQVVADTRLNQVLVVASPEDYTYIASLIAQFDRPLETEEPYERPLRYASAVDILPALVDVLQEASSGTPTQLPGGGTLATQRQQVQASSASQLLGGVRGSTTRGGQVLSTAAAAGGVDDGTGSTTAARPDLIQGPTEDNAPLSFLIDKTRLVADPMANSILVMGRKENIEKIDQLIDKLDRRPAQVYLATVIGQMTLEDGMQTGIDYITRFNRGGSDVGMAASSIFRRDNIITGNAITDMRDNLITSAFGPATGFNMYGAIGDSLDVFVNALETNTEFKVLSRPSVFALNNKKAVITSGQLIPVPSQIVTNTAGNINGLNVTTNVVYRDVVLKLEVVPLINDKGEVSLTIAQVNDTVIGTQRVEPNDIPIIGTEQLVTTVTVPNGNTVVLGGLISEERRVDTQGIPIISRLPVLGKLFREDVESNKRRELLIFIQPQVVTDENSLFDFSRKEDMRTKVGADAAVAFPQTVSGPVDEQMLPTPPPSRAGVLNRLFRRPNRSPLNR